MYTRNKSALCEYFYGISHVVKSNNFTHDYTRKDARFLRAQIGFAEKQLFAVLSVQCGVVVQWLDRQTTDGIAMPIAEPNVVGLTLSTRTHCQCGVTVRQVESCDFASMFWEDPLFSSVHSLHDWLSRPTYIFRPSGIDNEYNLELRECKPPPRLWPMLTL